MKIAGVRFHDQDKIYDFDQGDFSLAKGDQVIVETEQGIEAGAVVYCDQDVADKKTAGDYKPIIRKATTTDREKVESYRGRSEEAMEASRGYLKELGLPMKLVDVHFAFDGSKVTAYFTADERVDFRELVKKLTRHFQKSVRLQQVGARDAAGVVGGYGVCGRQICCRGFLQEFQSITADTVKLQQVAQGNEKISGACGRLMCCMAYEAKYYQEAAKEMPSLEQAVRTSKGRGKVVARNLLNKTVDVAFTEGDNVTFPLTEIKW